VDQIAPQIFKVGFNPRVYKDSGLKAWLLGGAHGTTSWSAWQFNRN